MKQGFKSKFLKNYKYRISKDEINLIWNRAYRYARILHKEDIAGFKKANDTTMSIAEKAYYIGKEYDIYKNKSRLSIYYNQNRNKTIKEKMEFAEMSIFKDRLDAKTSEKGGSFLEKYGDIEHNGTTINKLLNNKEITTKDLNEFIKEFKENNQYYLTNSREKEYYENLQKEEEKMEFFE